MEYLILWFIGSALLWAAVISTEAEVEAFEAERRSSERAKSQRIRELGEKKACDDLSA